jgi:hypothetical protein
MPPTINPTPLATEGNRSADDFQSSPDVASPGKPLAIRCLNAAIEAFIVPRNLSRAQLAEDLCGYTEGNFSKVANGQQGDFWALVYKLPADVRADFYDRLAETERVDPLLLAMEQLQAALLRVVRLTSAAMPAKASRMARGREQHAERKRA